MSSSPFEREWVPFTACPCGECEVVAAKLTKFGHALGCGCRSCIGRRNKRSGRKAQARSYRRLGGLAPFTPGHEENAGTFSVEVQVESKSGKQIPASFSKFTTLEWTRRALSQAERAIPEGVKANAAIYMEIPRQGAYLVVKL